METRLLVAGESVAGAGAPLDVEDPSDGSTLATLATASAEQVDAALAAAREAQPRWERTPAAERGELLHAVAAWLREHTEDIAVAMTREGGKPLLENRDEVGWTAACFDFYAELGRAHAGRVIPPVEPTQLALVLKEPVGVVACVVPWNYPLLLLAWKLAPALAAGNACVCKPSELTPLSTLMLAPAFAGFPPGVVSLLAGAGDVGALLVADERVDCVAFTGSVETGKAIARACIDRVARLHLELGGKDPFIVCPDVAGEIEIAARGGAWAAYLNAGQVCTSAERFYVHADVYDPFVEAFVEHAATLRVGDPMDPATDVGPMASAAQRDKVLAHMSDAVAAGAEVLIGGETRSPGNYLCPSVVTGAPGTTRLLREETFGPVAPIVRSRRSTRRSPTRTRRASGSARTSTRAICGPSCAACARSRRARSGSTTPSPTTTRARSAASSSRGWDASSGSRGSRRSWRPSTSTSSPSSR